MDDQNKKPEDNLFGFRYGNEREEKGETQTTKGPEFGYSGSAAERDGSAGETASASDTPDSGYLPPREETRFTYGPFGTDRERSSAYGSAYEGAEAQRPATPAVQPADREYRPFTVSGSGRNWEASKPPRKSSVRAIFASFMAGVVVVGGLMFAADRGDWFSTQAAAPASAAVASASDNGGAKTVANVSDVVRPNNIAKIFEQASPAVVKIETFVSASSGGGGGTGNWFDENPLFRQFFGDEYGDGSGGNGGGSGNGSGGGTDGSGSLQESGMGSGFIFDSTGYILTNQHVIADADQIKVTVTGHQEPYTAKLLGSSYDLDLAVLKIEGADFPTLKLGDSGSANMGDWVVAIGNPYGFDHTVTVGVLSSNEREISIQDSDGTRNYEHLLQTDASINPGNSGGPLINLNGEVIGINTAVSSQAQGIGFAIPTSTITEVLDNLKSNTKIPAKPSPFIGATLQDISSSAARQLGLSSTDGALVNSILYNSPAYKADLRQYDVILGMDGKSYKTKEELIEAIQKKAVGDKAILNVYRDGKKIDLTLTIGNKSDFADQSTEQQPQQQQQP
ncbi:S1C family serine protease [Cohnella sp. JJ-181]|uniref:S1C family serine protease n=1 Tax=Cohnella rhizoplanae TaxID=2974897 RepID=UPI00232D6B49|nr:trypsin-like peptidase domain-containing protein [Cohnella sp. JJ-181]